MSTPREVGLKRALGFWWLYTLAVGAVVGDGIFTFTGYAVASAGPSVIIAYLIAGVTQMFLMISFGELAVWRPTAGGPEPWVKELVSKRLGFLSSIAFSIGWIIAGGSVGLAIGTYMYNFFAYSGIEIGDRVLWVTAFSIILVTIFAVLNILGVAIAAGTQFVLTMLLIGLMVVYAANASLYINPANYEPFAPHGISGFLGAIPIGVYAYMGASTVLFAGEEAKRPVDIARVLFWSSLTFVILYTWALAACVGTLSWEEVTVFYEAIYAQSAMKIWGPVAAIVMNFGAWLAAATCLLMGTMYQPARDFYNLARTGYRLPRWFGYVHPKFRTPTYGIIFVWLVSVFLILLGTFVGHTLGYLLLGYELVWAWCVSWFLTLIAAIKFRRKYTEEAKKLPWKVPLWPITPALAVVGIALTVFAMFYDLAVSYGADIAAITGVISIAWVLLLGFGAKYLEKK
ncbi:amino acid permease [Thermofilum sp.]|uniref:APC family permease n=1 Tax=Thermofilum sp. TaxID=1961369 RepID=UPI00316A7E92